MFQIETTTATLSRHNGRYGVRLFCVKCIITAQNVENKGSGLKKVVKSAQCVGKIEVGQLRFGTIYMK
jgi:hypothetical protein